MGPAMRYMDAAERLRLAKLRLYASHYNLVKRTAIDGMSIRQVADLVHGREPSKLEVAKLGDDLRRRRSRSWPRCGASV
jgi:hypothetical protein